MLELLNFTPDEHGSTFIIDDIIFMSVKNLIKTSEKMCKVVYNSFLNIEVDRLQGEI